MSGIYPNMFTAQIKSKQPEVGDPCTMLMYSDRDPGTIKEISKSGKTIIVAADDWVRIDKLGMSDCQEYEYTTNLNNATYEYTLRKNGRWVRKGCNMWNSMSLIIGFRERYYDFTF